MHFFTYITCPLLIAVALAAAVPAPVPKSSLNRRTFQVKRVRNPGYVRDPRKALDKAYRKWGWALHGHHRHHGHHNVTSIPPQNATGVQASAAGSSLTVPPKLATALPTDRTQVSPLPASIQPDTTAIKAAGPGRGEVTATPTGGDSEYLSPVTIGGQTVMMDFDTGSADLWVLNTGTTGFAGSPNAAFDSAKSPTFKLMSGASFRLKYGDGSTASGIVGTDVVDIGGATVTNQAVELAQSVSGSFLQDLQNDGLVGLAYSKLNNVQPTQQQTFFENAISNLEQPVFTAQLKHGIAGTYDFGFIDTAKFTGQLSFVPIDTTSGWWQFSATNYMVNGQLIQIANGDSIADTGTTLMLVSNTLVDAYYSQVSGALYDSSQGGMVFPCSTNIPDLNVSISGATYTIPGNLINFAQVSAGMCFGGLQSNQGSHIQIFGDIFFKAVFVVFDGGNNRLGFAPHS